MISVRHIRIFLGDNDPMLRPHSPRRYNPPAAPEPPPAAEPDAGNSGLLRLEAVHGLPAHAALLVACATVEVNEASHRAVDAALSLPGLDWPAAVRASIRHGVAPLVALHLQSFAADPRIPPEVAACFDRIYRANAARNQVIFRETARLARALAEAGIPFLVLKGVALALTVYPDPTLRHFADLDILVAPQDFQAACTVAEACGFKQEVKEVISRSHHIPYLYVCAEDIFSGTVAPEFDSSLTPELLSRHGHQFRVEIHHGLFCLLGGIVRNVDLAPFWQEAQKTALPDGTSVRLPSPEPMLVHLAAHAASHLYGRLLYPIDAAQVIHCYSTQIDWDWLIELASRCGESASVYRLMTLAQQFGAEIPAQTLHRLREAPGGKAARHPLLLTQIFKVDPKDHSVQMWQQWRMLGNTRDRLTALRYVLFPPAPILRADYGIESPYLLPPLYLYRPLHVAWRLVRILLRRAKSHLPEQH